MFINIKGNQFFKNNESYKFIGTNFWYGANLGAELSGDRSRLIKELDLLKEKGITNLRVMAASEGKDHSPYRIPISLQPELGIYNEDILEGFDFLISEMRKRDMVAVVCLNNFWYWSGGMAQYVNWVTNKDIPYPNDTDDWEKYMHYTSKFYTIKSAVDAYNDHIKKIITRKNIYTNTYNFDEPTIMSWELANEPYAMMHQVEYLDWIKSSSSIIKTLAPNQLITIGGEGNTPFPWFTNNNSLVDYNFESIDYITIHIWIQNWQWYNPENHDNTYKNALEKVKQYLDQHITIANTLNKPIVLEEFGISRDMLDYTKNSSVLNRDIYYKDVFDILLEHVKSNSSFCGCNFWAWGGFGNVNTPGEVTNNDLEYIGDPSHEPQGWYSVFESDITTTDLIKNYNNLIQNVMLA